MKLLTRSETQRALSMREAIEVVKRAFAELSTGKANSPLRTAVPLPNHDGLTLFMPAYLGESDALAVKIVSIHQRNPERDCPEFTPWWLGLIRPQENRWLSWTADI